MSMSIIKSGLYDTIQDLGRNGYSNNGVNPGGVMDHFAAKMANALVGNDETDAVLEIHFPGPQVLFEKDALISITGAGFHPTVNNEAIPCWQPVFLKKNTVLQFTAREWGARAYLAIHGGFCIQKWLNSYSTNMKAGMGGYKGRKLEKGDTLPFEKTFQHIHKYIKPASNYKVLPWRPVIANVYDQPAKVHFMYGNEWNHLTCCARKAVEKNPFHISIMSDRMGYRLQGESLALTSSGEMISSAVSYGTMQLLPGGQLIVLMADHQTTGGYPKIGHVISAHLPKLAQLSAGDSIEFVPSEISRAEEMLFAQQKNLSIMRRACLDHINSVL